MKNVKDKIRLYLKRIARDKSLPRYELEEQGLWQVTPRLYSGYEKDCEILRNKVLRGRFVDAIGYAVNQRGFYAEWCSEDNPDNRNNGHVRKMDTVNLSSDKISRDFSYQS